MHSPISRTVRVVALIAPPPASLRSRSTCTRLPARTCANPKPRRWRVHGSSKQFLRSKRA